MIHDFGSGVLMAHVSFVNRVTTDSEGFDFSGHGGALYEIDQEILELLKKRDPLFCDADDLLLLEQRQIEAKETF